MEINIIFVLIILSIYFRAEKKVKEGISEGGREFSCGFFRAPKGDLRRT